jgi:hypothetical protein
MNNTQNKQPFTGTKWKFIYEAEAPRKYGEEICVIPGKE